MSTWGHLTGTRTPCSLPSFPDFIPLRRCRKGGLVKNYSAQDLGSGEASVLVLERNQPQAQSPGESKTAKPGIQKGRICIWGGHRKGLLRHMPKTVTPHTRRGQKMLPVAERSWMTPGWRKREY